MRRKVYGNLQAPEPWNDPGEVEKIEVEGADGSATMTDDVVDEVLEELIESLITKLRESVKESQSKTYAQQLTEENEVLSADYSRNTKKKFSPKNY